MTIIPPLITQPVQNISLLYTLIEARNENSSPDKIHKFMKDNDQYGISLESYTDFKKNYEKNYKLCTRALVLSGASEEEIENSITEYETIFTLIRLQKDLQKITING